MRFQSLLALFGLVGLTASVGVINGADEPAATAVKKAVCVVHGLGDHSITGTVTFTAREGFVDVEAIIKGLSPGLHGFHIHEFGDLTSADGMSAGGHFNPTHMQHAAPDATMHHAGDLGNLVADKDGIAKLELKVKMMHLNGPLSIIGRAIIIHDKADDLHSQPAGDAGKRIAGGIIGIAKSD